MSARRALRGKAAKNIDQVTEEESMGKVIHGKPLLLAGIGKHPLDVRRHAVDGRRANALAGPKAIHVAGRA